MKGAPKVSSTAAEAQPGAPAATATTPAMHQGYLAPVPMVMDAEEQEVMSSALLPRMPGDYLVPMTMMLPPLPCACISSKWTMSQTENTSAFTGTAANTTYCCFVHCPSADGITNLAIDDTGMTFNQTILLQDGKRSAKFSIPGVLTSFDRNALIATYSFSGRAPHGHVEGVIVLDGKAGTIVTKYGGAWKGITLRGRKLGKSWQTVV
jgi:hypothetical protein